MEAYALNFIVQDALNFLGVPGHSRAKTMLPKLNNWIPQVRLLFFAILYATPPLQTGVRVFILSPQFDFIVIYYIV